MLNLKHILFPVDLSEQCATVAPFVEAWATQFGARVTLLNVLEMPPAYYADSAAVIASVDIESLLEARRKCLETFASQSFRVVRDQRIVQMGLTATTILDFVAREGVDLIMMPSHGYGPFRRFLLGSVTAKVLHDAPCPVWTGVHMDQSASAASPSDCRRILCAIDLTPKSVQIMRWAKQLAEAYGATLQFVHAVTGWPDESMIPETDRFRAVMLAFARKEIEKLQEQAGTSADIQLRGGEIAPVVHRAALDFNADLVVIGRGVLRETLGRLRTHSYAIIREAPCPVISV
jgi:nucleotide-binding universal stress UspA family protein